MFVTGKPVSGKSFIDRKKHIPLFRTYLEQNQSFMIKAPRRFGKTSLVKHLLEGKKEFIYIDVKRVSSLQSLANKIIDSAYKLSTIDNFLYKAQNSLFDLFKSIQQLQIDDIAEVTIKLLEKKESDAMEFFLHSLDVVEQIAQKQNLQVKFVFDEFQDILTITSYDILDKTRSVMQHHNHITYIFLGSIESIMTKIFEHKSSAFFHFAIIVELPPLDVEELYQYSVDVFKQKNIEVEGLKEVLEFFKGHPDYSLQFLQKLYFTALAEEKKRFHTLELLELLQEVFFANKAYIEELISKAKQKKHSLDVLYSIANNTKVKLDSKTLYNVHKSLEDMGLIKRVKTGHYVINDLFLELYLQQNGDVIEFKQFI